MGEQNKHYYTAFDESKCIAQGDLLEVAGIVKQLMGQGNPGTLLIFDDGTGETAEVDFRGTLEDVIDRLKKYPFAVAQDSDETEPQTPGPKGPGRPKLGVVSREVTLLPRHWEWLNSQPGGASVALRKLVEEARKAYRHRDQIRQSREAAYRFMDALAGNLPGFEEATRALFAGNFEKFNAHLNAWPKDIREYALKLSEPAFEILKNQEQ